MDITVYQSLNLDKVENYKTHSLFITSSLDFEHIYYRYSNINSVLRDGLYFYNIYISKYVLLEYNLTAINDISIFIKVHEFMMFDEAAQRLEELYSIKKNILFGKDIRNGINIEYLNRCNFEIDKLKSKLYRLSSKNIIDLISNLNYHLSDNSNIILLLNTALYSI